jgi:hypothetical protein
MAMENLSIAQHWDTLWYAHTWGGSYKPKVKQFDVGDFVYLQWQLNNTLDTSSDRIILRIKAIMPSCVLELQGADDAQFMITPKTMRLATCWTWILPSSRRFGFLHLTIHVKYVRGQMMLIRCCFAIIVMVDTIYYASNRSTLKFMSTFSIVHHVFLQHLDFYSDHATLFLTQV